MKRINAVKSGSVIGNGSRFELMKWLERYVETLFPQSGIEYWSSGFGAEPDEPVGQIGGEDGIVHFACYVRKEHCEGRVIEIDALYRNNRFARLITVKSFGSPAECWQIAEAITNALEHIYSYHEIPLLVEMSNSLPRRHHWDREPALRGPVKITRGPTSLSVANDGKTLWERKVDKAPDVAKLYLDAYYTDWCTVLSNLDNVLVETEVTEDAAMIEVTRA